MLLNYCDICGKQISLLSNSEITLKGFETSPLSLGCGEVSRHYDLCDDYFKEVSNCIDFYISQKGKILYFTKR